MPITFILGGILIFLIYFSLNFYIGFRAFHALKIIFPFLTAKVFWPLLGILALSFLIVRFFNIESPLLTKIGDYWIAAFFYLLLLFLVMDVLRWLSTKITYIPDNISIFFKQGYSGLIVIGLVLILLLYGTWNAQNPKIVTYNVSIDKSVPSLENIKIIILADLHVSPLTQDLYMDKMTAHIKSLNPDMILIAGDLIDGTLTDKIGSQLKNFFAKATAESGIYAVLGNHEYYGHMADEISSYLKQQGIKVLQDDKILLDNSIYIIGREDYGSSYIAGEKRKTLEQLLTGIDFQKPVILLDHQPRELKQAAELGVDLMFSGHTHGGQLFPFQIATKSAYGINKGYLQKNSMQLIVTSGIGTWGPPMRIGSHSEIVEVNINFSKNK